MPISIQWVELFFKNRNFIFDSASTKNFMIKTVDRNIEITDYVSIFIEKKSQVLFFKSYMLEFWCRCFLRYFNLSFIFHAIDKGCRVLYIKWQIQIQA